MFQIRFASIVLTASVSLLCRSPLWAADCNGNGADDATDIANGTSRDCNRNGVPDECDVTFTLGFADAISLSVSGVGPSSLLVADLDNDGDLDLAGAASNSVPTFLNNGDATFKSEQYASVTPNASSIVAVDLDLDRDLDFATSSYDPPSVSVLLNNGETTFTESLNLPVGRNPWSITSGDFDGDGDIDLAVADRFLHGVWILRNSGGGIFEVSDNLPVGDFPESVVAADLDRDGDVDLAAANTSSRNVSVLLNNANKTFEVATNYNTGGSASSLTVADLDNDGDNDLAVANIYDGNVAVLLNDGDTTFQLAGNFAAGIYPHSITATDLDGDRDLDLAMVNVGTVANPGRTISILLNSGSARFNMLQTMAVNGRPVALGASDLDRDGDVDLAVAICGTASCGANNYIAVLLNDGKIIPAVSQDRNQNGIPDECEVPPPCSPDAEVYDEMQTELSHNIEVFGLGRVCTADLAGIIGVKRYLPYVDSATGLRTIATKITKLELTGTDPTCGKINISLNPNLASGGKVVEQKAGTCFPADSFFDVFIQVQIPDQKLLANCEKATMRCVVSALPPIGCVYQLGTGLDVSLYDAASLDCASPGNPVANIVAADHKPTAAPVPPVVIQPQTRIQLHLFHQNQWLPLTDQVRKDHFHATLPVVVIVHGWNRQLLDGLTAWNELATAVATRLTNPLGQQVNILAWDWMEEAKGGTAQTFIGTRFQEAAANVFNQSRLLARCLQRLFQADAKILFQQPIHLMGHSLGAGLVAMTGIWLQHSDFGGGTYPVANVTLFDPPDRVPVLNWPIVNSLDTNVPVLRSFTPPTAVDCFSGTFNDLTYYSNVWYVVPGGGHDTFNWYRTHLLQDVEPTLHRRLNCDDTALESTVGFGASAATHAPAERQLQLSVCQTAERDVSLVAHSADGGCRARDEFVFAQYCIANAGTTDPLITIRLDLGLANGNCECVVPPDLDPEREGTRVRMRLRRPGQGGGGGQEKNLTATFTLPLTVTPKWDYVSFTYRIETAPASATVTLSIQDGASVVPLWLATSDSDLGELADSTLLNITPYHGKEVSLIFSLSSIEPDAIVEVSNLTLVQGPFHDNVAPVSNAGTDQAVAVSDPLATPVVLDGSGSTDANGDPLVYVWTATQDPAVAEQEGIIAVGENPTVELPLGGYQFTLHARDPFDGFSSDDVIVEVEYPFIRGDSNADGKFDITDAIATLTSLFLDTSKSICLDAADTNNDAEVNISDPVALLGFLFLGTEAPQPPFPGVGLDPTPDLLGCTLKQR